ncbi:hypothetical protein MAR_009235, partial [Mya arenaria]
MKETKNYCTVNLHDHNRNIKYTSDAKHMLKTASAFSIVKVNLTAQVISSTVALKKLKKLSFFLRNFDKFFDCLNVRNPFEGEATGTIYKFSSEECNDAVQTDTEWITPNMECTPFVFTHSFNEAPLEQHCGNYRSKCGSNVNPN